MISIECYDMIIFEDVCILQRLNCSNIVTPLLFQHCGERHSHLLFYAETPYLHIWRQTTHMHVKYLYTTWKCIKLHKKNNLRNRTYLTGGDTWYPVQIVGFPSNGVIEVIIKGEWPFATSRIWNYTVAALLSVVSELIVL